MQILKSLLVVVSLLFCAVQVNATVSPVVSSIEMGGIIEWEELSRELSIQVNTNELVELILINSNDRVVYKDILGGQGHYFIDLQHLPSGAYKLIATCNSGSANETLIIE